MKLFSSPHLSLLLVIKKLLIPILILLSGLAYTEVTYIPVFHKGVGQINGVLYTDSGASISNLGNAPATFRPYFTDSMGNTTIGEQTTIGVNGSTLLEGAPSGFSAVRLVSNQPLSAINNIVIGNRKLHAAYTGTSIAKKKIYLPLIMCNNYGFNTWFALQNTSSQTSTVTVKYYESGAPIDDPIEETFDMPPRSSKLLDQATNSGPGLGCSSNGSGLGNRFVGSVVITASKNMTAIAAQVRTNSDSDSLTAYEGFYKGAKEVALPLLSINNYGWDTGISVQNVSQTESVNVSLEATCENPSASFQDQATITPFQSHNFIYLSNNLPTCVGSVKLTIDSNAPSAGIAAIVNQVNYEEEQTSSYSGFDVDDARSGAIFPLVMDRHYDYYTAFQVQNIGNEDTYVSCLFSNCSSNPNCLQTKPIHSGSSESFSQRNAFHNGYVGAAMCFSHSPEVPIVGIANQVKINNNPGEDNTLTYSSVPYDSPFTHCVEAGEASTLNFNVGGQQLKLTIPEGALTTPSCFYADQGESLNINTAVSDAFLLGPPQILLDKPACVTLPISLSDFNELPEEYREEALAIMVKDPAHTEEAPRLRRLRTTLNLDPANPTATACDVRLGTFQAIVPQQLLQQLEHIDNIPPEPEPAAMCERFEDYMDFGNPADEIALGLYGNVALGLTTTVGGQMFRGGLDAVWSFNGGQFAMFSYSGKGHNLGVATAGGEGSVGVGFSSESSVIEAWSGHSGVVSHGHTMPFPYPSLLESSVGFELFTSYATDEDGNPIGPITPPDGTFGAAATASISGGVDWPIQALDIVGLPSTHVSRWTPFDYGTNLSYNIFNALNPGKAELKGVTGEKYIQYKLDNTTPNKYVVRNKAMAKDMLLQSGGEDPVINRVAEDGVYVGAWRDWSTNRVCPDFNTPNIKSACDCINGECPYKFKTYQSEDPPGVYAGDCLPQFKNSIMPKKNRHCIVNKLTGEVYAREAIGFSTRNGPPATLTACSHVQDDDRNLGIYCCLADYEPPSRPIRPGLDVKNIGTVKNIGDVKNMVAVKNIGASTASN